MNRRNPVEEPWTGDAFRMTSGAYLLVTHSGLDGVVTFRLTGEDGQQPRIRTASALSGFLRGDGAALMERAEDSSWIHAGDPRYRATATAQEGIDHLQAIVLKYSPRPVSDQSAPRFYRPDGTFDPAAFSRAFWRMASPAYNGAEFPLHDDPKTAGMTEADVTRLVAANITSHALWVGGGSAEPALVEELLSMEFVVGAAQLLVELGTQREALLREGA